MSGMGTVPAGTGMGMGMGIGMHGGTGMAMGPASRTDLGSFGWFAWVWATMMAAMMLPSLAPAVVADPDAGSMPRAAIASHDVARGAGRLTTALLFATGYMIVWSATGLLAYGLIDGARHIAPIAWNDGGRYLAAAVLLGTAAYELSPLKAGCLSMCRNWQPPPAPTRPLKALQDGLQHGRYCLGCCWALMAALFALGVMKIGWMIVIAAVIAAQKLLPQRLASRPATAALLAALSVVTLV